MIDWLLDEPARANYAALCVVITIVAIGAWLGRRRLKVTLPLAFLFLFMAAVTIPNIDWGNRVADKNNCINNLRKIDRAKAEWAHVYHKLPTDVPTELDLIGTNKFLPSMPTCPANGKYTIESVDKKPVCSLVENGHRLE